GQPGPRLERSGSLGSRCRQAGRREIAIIVGEAAAGGGQRRAAQAHDGQRGIEREELARQFAGVEIPGRFAARQEEACAQEAGRLNSAESIGGLILISVTLRSTERVPIFRVALNATCTPSTGR